MDLPVKIDTFTGYSIHGLPIGKPFRTKVYMPQAKRKESESSEGVFIIYEFRNEQESEIIDLLPDITDDVNNEELIAHASMNHTITSKTECRCHLLPETYDKSLQTDSDDIDSPHGDEAYVDVVHVKTEVGIVEPLLVRLNFNNKSDKFECDYNQRTYTEDEGDEEFTDKDGMPSEDRTIHGMPSEDRTIHRYPEGEDLTMGNNDYNELEDQKVLVDEVVTDALVEAKEYDSNRLLQCHDEESRQMEDYYSENITVDSNDNDSGRNKTNETETGNHQGFHPCKYENNDIETYTNSDEPKKREMGKKKQSSGKNNILNSGQKYVQKVERKSAKSAKAAVHYADKHCEKPSKKRKGKVSKPEVSCDKGKSSNSDTLETSNINSHLVEPKQNVQGKKRKLSNELKDGEDDDKNFGLEALSAKERKLHRTKMLKEGQKLKKDMKRIKVKLQDHTDKYRVEMMVSYERKDRAKASEESAVETLVCTICEKFKVWNKATLETHIERHLNGELHCHDCDFIATFPRELQKHQREVHKQNIMICSECGEETNGTLGLMNHLGRVHNKPQFKCDYCLKDRDVHFACIRKTLLNDHVRSEHPEKLFHCSTCSKMYETAHMLRIHRNRGCQGNEPKVYPCETCGKKYNGINRLTYHIERVHKRIRRNQCPHCPFAAPQPSKLALHMHTHTGYHPVKCDQCTFTCIQNYQLKTHMRTHTGDKPYKCGQCSYASAWNVQLKEHVKVHGMPNTVTCDQCNIVFKDLRGLKMHSGKEHSQNAK